MPKFLIIQTAFTGDVVLATAIAEKIHNYYPEDQIDFLLRKGNEGLLKGHPFIKNVLVWDKKTNKNLNLLKIISRVKNEQYTHVINAHRFITSGLITYFSGAPNKIGFDKNPFAFCYTRKVPHTFSPNGAKNPIHETKRYQQLIADLTDETPVMPALYPSKDDYESVRQYQSKPYICIAPSSVWFTKQFPARKWAELINALPATHNIYLIGAPSDADNAKEIIHSSSHNGTQNLCGKLSFLQSAAIMAGAVMNYTNDSAPLHFASAMDAPLTAVFCSTVPSFGFGPLRATAHVVETQEKLPCRPCGLHGYKACPKKHFNCAHGITNEQLLWWTSKTI